MKIKAVLSDGGNILFSDRDTKQAEWLRLCQVNYVPFPEFYAAFRPFHRRAQTEPDYSRADAFEEYLSTQGIKPEKLPESENKGKRLSLYDHVEETLARLKASGRKFIILTDATKRGDKLKQYLSRLGISQSVDDLISSKDVGHTKPAKEFFDHVLRKHGLGKQNVLFLGHDHDELYGAHQLGIEVVAFNYDPKDDLSFIPAQNRISRFDQLMEVIDRYEKR